MGGGIGIEGIGNGTGKSRREGDKDRIGECATAFRSPIPSIPILYSFLYK